MEKAVFAGGCFWCTEAVFQRLKGVESVLPGYSGGDVENPSYDEVSSGATGHAEAIQITYDSSVISFEKLVEIFFHLHDPTTLNRQGNDVGTQYRSAVFYMDENQKKVAEKIKEKIEQEKIYKDKIVTQIVPFKAFYQAEDYHKNYYENNRDAGYCRVIIDPKIKKLIAEYSKELK